MKFDVIVGNPPFNNERQTTSNSATLDKYPSFVDKGYELMKNDGLLLFITPSRWFSKPRLSNFKNRMTQDYGLKALWHSDKKVFDGTDIKGRTSFFILKKGYVGLTWLNFLNQSFDVRAEPDILITRNAKTLNLIKKIQKHKTIESNCKCQDYFNIKSNSKFFSDTMNKDFVKCIVSRRKGNVRFVPLSVVKNQQDINKWKVLLRSSDGRGRDYTKYHILAEPGTICSGSFVCFCFDTKEEATNFVSYFETKFFKYLMHMLKITQNISKKVFSLIPEVDFSVQWNDEKIQQFFNLTKEEIALIESVVI